MRSNRPTTIDGLGGGGDSRATYSTIGSPTLLICWMVHLRSNALLSTILKIFCTLTECDVEQKISGARMALANFLACFVMSSCSCGDILANKSNFVPTKNDTAVYMYDGQWSLSYAAANRQYTAGKGKDSWQRLGRAEVVAVRAIMSHVLPY